MFDTLDDATLQTILRELDVETLAVAEATCKTLMQAVRKVVISGVAITSPRSECYSSPAHTVSFAKFIRWLKGHAQQFRSVVIAENDPDAAGAIGIALSGGSNLFSLMAISNSSSGWRIPSCMVYASPGPVPPLTTLLLGRSSVSPMFIEAFEKTLRSLTITVSTMEQAKDVLGLCLPELMDLRVTAICSMPFLHAGQGGGTFPKLRCLFMKNFNFGSRVLRQGPKDLDSLEFINCEAVQMSRLSQLPVTVHFGIHDMVFPSGFDLSRLHELSVHRLKRSIPDMKLPQLRRFQASYSDISMKATNIPNIWAATIGEGCTGDKRWLHKVPYVTCDHHVN